MTRTSDSVTVDVTALPTAFLAELHLALAFPGGQRTAAVQGGLRGLLRIYWCLKKTKKEKASRWGSLCLDPGHEWLPS